MRTPGRTRGRKPFRATLERLEGRQLLATYVVRTTTDPLNVPLNLIDPNQLSLREAIQLANARPGPDNIAFGLPTDQGNPPTFPAVDFDNSTQTWRIQLNAALPTLTDPVTIDGLTQARVGIPYLYPAQSADNPSQIISTPSTLAAKDGNDAALRVIIDGSQTNGATGFDIQSTHTILRGLIIDGFGTGVSVSGQDATGVLVQGNSIGRYFVYPVNTTTGDPLPGAASAQLVGFGNSGPGVLIRTTNATVGGRLPQEANIIGGNAGPGIRVTNEAVGNLIAGNQIGVAGPTVNGLFSIAPNGAEGIRIESSGLTREPGSLLSSSTTVDLNLISANGGDGIHVKGPASDSATTRINITGNYIGVGPGGGFRFGSTNTGNGGDGIWLENAADNRIGGSSDRDRNVITANQGAGVRVSGANATPNLVLGNNIGVTAGGDGALGNRLEGVVLGSSGNTVGPGNLISANLRGVLISGAGAANNVVTGNRIGTDVTGLFDLGNAREGIRIEGAANNQITGTTANPQVISGNNVGLLIVGAGAAGNAVRGNLIGTTISGTADLGNSLEGVRVEDAPQNTIGGTAAADRNVISSNHWGVRLTGAGTFGNLVQGNSIGTDAGATLPLGNELDGVLIDNAAFGNSIGGSAAGAGNAIAFNRQDGVRLDGAGAGNAILGNRIFGNGGQAIRRLPPPPTAPVSPPVLAAVEPGETTTTIRGTQSGAPGTPFTIQFFDVDSGNLLGEITATTDATGTAPFAAVIPLVIAPGQRVTATATDPFGNTSEFATPLTVQPATLSFAMTGFTVVEGVPTATITVTRTGAANTAVSVVFSTADGTARAGVDYQSVTRTLNFAAGQTSQDVTIPILSNPELEGPETVLLNLASPGGGAVLGVQSSAVLTIVDDTADRTGPVVVSARAVGGRLGVASVILAFSEPLDPDRAIALVNYGYGVRIAGRDGRLGTRDDLLIGIAAAAYDPVARTVTLTLGRPVLKRTALRVAINQATDVPGAGVGVSDVAGNLLDGDADGRPGGSYVTKVVARPVPRRPRVGVGRPRARAR